MNHAGEIAPLVRMVRPHVAMITTVAPVHLGILQEREGYRRGQGRDLRRRRAGRRAVINRDNAHFDALAKHARRRRRGARDRLRRACARRRSGWRIVLQADSSFARRESSASRSTFTLGAPGRHLVAEQPRGAWPRSRSSAATSPSRASALAPHDAAEGAGRRATSCDSAGSAHADRRELQRQSGLDARRDRAARPGAARPAAAGASPCSATCWNSAPSREKLHAALAEPLIEAGIDTSFSPAR